MRRASINTWFRFIGGAGNVWAYSKFSGPSDDLRSGENSDVVIADLALVWRGASCI